MENLSEHITVKHTQLAEVLAKIVKDKAIWVDARKKTQPLASFKALLTPSDRNFYQAVKSDNTTFILECKKASPSKGLIRNNFNLDEIASVYKHYANAISVLTDEKYFQGNVEFINRVRSQVSQPILCKDFILEPYQVYLARYYQADAILLMLSVLDDQRYLEMAELAHSLNMGVLTEASNQQELERAVQLGAQVIGINNRNLRDLTTDLDRTRQLAPLLPETVTVIAESGIYTNQQVRELSHYVDGFLIGSALMSETNLEKAVRKIILGENKVCGLTSIKDAQAAYDAGAVFGGLIFVTQSQRYVSPEQAAAIVRSVPLDFVGVFQNESIDKITRIVREVGLYAIQLHGNEDQQFISELRKHVPTSVQIWQAYGVQSVLPEKYATDVDRHIFDRQMRAQSGGTGQTFDWSLLTHIDVSDVMIAGGLSPDNITQATSIHALGLDLNSGVESYPGLKDPVKLKLAFEQIRNY